MTRKSLTLCVSILALLLCASVYAGSATSKATSDMTEAPLSVSISGCFASGYGDYICVASASGGSGSYNYWWQHSGNGQSYQNNTSTVSITGCVGGSFTLRVSIRDRSTGQLTTSGFHTVSCGGLGIGFG